MRYPTALTIAGSDSGGGAGIQADLKTLAALGVFGTSALTAITAQNTHEVRDVFPIPPDTVRKQLEAILDDFHVDAVKTGMLVSPEIIETVASVVKQYRLNNLVVDPVITATAGTSLTQADSIDALHTYLFPLLTILTPNIPEAELLTGISIQNREDVYAAGDRLLSQGCRAVLIKGGHQQANKTSTDILFSTGEKPLSFDSEWITTHNLHGTGCTLASAITACLALGAPLPIAVKQSKRYITEAIRSGATANFNKGNGPLNHFFNPQPLKPII